MMLKCVHCDKVFKYESERNRHQESHFPQFGCPVCAKKFSFLSALRRHQKQHERKGSVRCNECGGQFRDEILLKRHTQYAHTGNYSCLECSSTFSSEQALRTHSKIHRPESERRFRCTFAGCNKTFNFPHHLKHHELTHTNAKQHFCNVCRKGFIQSHHLKTHLKMHHSQNWLLCSVPSCKNIFTTKYALKKHLATHNRCNAVKSTELKFDSGISSDSSSANDLHEKRVTDDNVLCATCGKLILGLQYLNHTLKCISSSKDRLEYKLEGAQPNYDGNFELRDPTTSTYTDLKAEVHKKCTSGFEDIYRCDISEHKSFAETKISGVAVNLSTGGECADDRPFSLSGNHDNILSVKTQSSCSCRDNNMPEMEYRKDGTVKIRETFDVDIIVSKETADVLKSKLKTELNDLKHVPFYSCKAVLGNCIVSEDGSVGEGCLCAKMIIDEQQMSAQEIEELTPNPSATWV